MNNGLCVTIKKGKKLYTVWGVQSFAPMAKQPNGITLFVNKTSDTDRGVYFIKNAKVIEAYPTTCPTDASQIENL